MATLKCLACGHDNDVGDESCSSCSSSLNLKLCSACEAINANDAERCHSCNAQFSVAPEWLATGQARKRSARSTAWLPVLPLMVGGAAYYFYASSEATTPPHAAPKVEAAQKSEPQSQPELAPSGGPGRQPAAGAGPAPAAPVRGRPPDRKGTRAVA